MHLSDRAIQMFAKDLGMQPNDLRNQLDNLAEQFRQSYTRSDWLGCLDVVKKQNRLLGLCPIEPESDRDVKEGFSDGFALTNQSNRQQFLAALARNDKPECLKLLLAEYQYACSKPKKQRVHKKRSVSKLITPRSKHLKR